MFCANCGTENDEGVAFCSNCGKNPNDVVTKEEDKKMANYPLIILSSKLFYPIYELSLWLFLIIGTVGGGIAGYWIYKATHYYGDGAGGAAFLGVIIGFLISFCCMIISSGIISIFLKMNQNIEKLEKK